MADIPQMSDERLADLMISRENWLKNRMAGLEREKRVPQVGEEVPDFNLERLTPEGKRTGDYVMLSSLRGKPVALYFGSYT